jgi:hypothetical protein
MTNEAALKQVEEMRRRVDEARQGAVRTARVASTVMGTLCALGSLGLLAAVALGRVPVQAGAGVIFLGLFAALALRSARSLRRPEHLEREGLPVVAVFERVVGTGTQLHVESSSMSGTVAQMRMRFMIEGEGHGARPVEVTDLVPTFAYAKLVAGTRLRAWVDRRDPDQVLIGWNAPA